MKNQPYSHQEVLCEINLPSNTPYAQVVAMVNEAGGDTRFLKGASGQFTIKMARYQVEKLNLPKSQTKIEEID